MDERNQDPGGAAAPDPLERRLAAWFEAEVVDAGRPIRAAERAHAAEQDVGMGERRVRRAGLSLAGLGTFLVAALALVLALPILRGHVTSPTTAPTDSPIAATGPGSPGPSVAPTPGPTLAATPGPTLAATPGLVTARYPDGLPSRLGDVPVLRAGEGIVRAMTSETDAPFLVAGWFGWSGTYVTCALTIARAGQRQAGPRASPRVRRHAPARPRPRRHADRDQRIGHMADHLVRRVRPAAGRAGRAAGPRPRRPFGDLPRRPARALRGRHRRRRHSVGRGRGDGRRPHQRSERGRARPGRGRGHRASRGALREGARVEAVVRRLPDRPLVSPRGRSPARRCSSSSPRPPTARQPRRPAASAGRGTRGSGAPTRRTRRWPRTTWSSWAPAPARPG